MKGWTVRKVRCKFSSILPSVECYQIEDGEAFNMKQWIFLGSPDNFNVDEYVKRHPLIYWQVSRYRDEIHIGDIVFIWRSMGKGKIKAVPGIIARGKVGELPKPLYEIDHRENLYLKYDDEVAKGGRSSQVKAGILIDSVRLSAETGMITRKTFELDSLLQRNPVITFGASSNFSLSYEEYQRVEELWNRNA